MKFVVLLRGLAVSFSFVLAACSSDEQSSAGSGSTGSAGSSTSSGSAATGTTSGATGTVGSSGSGSTAGTSGSAGAGGLSGATSGSGGSGGGSGTGGGTGAGGRGSGGTGSGGTGSGGTGAGGTGSGGGAIDAGNGGTASPMMNFFVSSDTSTTANLGGLTGADQRCQRLATAAGFGSKTWHAYLSAANPVTNARDRIGEGPYYNASGVMLAATKAALHARNGDPLLFITEKGQKINGQWTGSPAPLEHDILTGSNVDGTLMANVTCGDWTATTGSSWVGHTDGLGPQMSTADMYIHWSSSHMGQCGNTAPGGGAGRIYCFVAP